SSLLSDLGLPAREWLDDPHTAALPPAAHVSPREQRVENPGAQRAAQMRLALGPVQTRRRESPARRAGRVHVDSTPHERAHAGGGQLVGRSLPRPLKQPVPSPHLLEELDALDTGEVIITGTRAPKRSVPASLASDPG